MSTTTVTYKNEVQESTLPSTSSPHNSNHFTAHQSDITLEAALATTPQEHVPGASNSKAAKYRELFITTLIIACNLIQFISNAVGIVAGLTIGKQLGIDGGPSQANWMAASYSLTQGTFVLIAGRLGAIYGHNSILLIGSAIFTLFSLANGFCEDYVSFASVRALTGIGGALIMPSAVAMLSITTPPGKLRNFCIGLFAASAPLGGWLGALLAGIFSDWRWIFWLMTIMMAVVTAILFFILPKEQPVDPKGRIDYVGAFLGVASLIMFNFVWNQAPTAGWDTSYIIVILVASVISFTAFIVWERQYATEPIMPLSIFKTPTFSALVTVVMFSYMAFATSLWYMVAWQQLLRHWTPMKIAIGWIPFGLGAVASTFLAAWLIPRLAAQWIVVIGASCIGVSNLLLATMPEQQTYWAQTFPAILIGSLCPDFVFTAAQIIACNSVSRRQQGVAASLIGTLNLYSCSLGLGFSGTIESQIDLGTTDPTKGYRAALYFGSGLAVVAVVVSSVFVRVPEDKREGWTEAQDGHPSTVMVSGSDAIALETQAGSSVQMRVQSTA